MSTEVAPVIDPWCEAMRRGAYAEAWAISDAILRQRRAKGRPCWDLPRHLQYVWSGESLVGRRVLVRCYHGLGDTIQFIRFAAPLRRIAREVIVWAQAPLLPLIRGVNGVDRVLALHDGTPEADYDADIEIMELPHALRMTRVPAEVPYLPLPQRAEAFPRQPGALHVGIVWQAGDWDVRRSIPLAQLARLAERPHVRLFSLQRAAAGQDAAQFGIPDIGSDDVLELAARMRGLDLIISVDTMVAHLAGALGLPVWTLLHSDPDWRWMAGRSDSPWYPTMRLFRQSRPGDWGPVIRLIQTEIQALSGGRRGPGNKPSLDALAAGQECSSAPDGARVAAAPAKTRQTG